MTDHWEGLFEGNESQKGLIEIVTAEAKNEAQLDAIITRAVVPALFRRKQDQKNIPTFLNLFRHHIEKETTFEGKVDAAAVFLRMMKDVRRKLAAATKPEPDRRRPIGDQAALLARDVTDGIIHPTTTDIVQLDTENPYGWLPVPIEELPPHLQPIAHELSAPTPITELEPPAAETAKTFEQLCERALHLRLEGVLRFFHHRNPTQVSRTLAPDFLLSPEFSEKFQRVVTDYILPDILTNRSFKVLAASQRWDTANTDTFWQKISEQPNLKDKLWALWEQGWDNLKLVENGRNEAGQKKWSRPPALKTVRDMLKPEEGAYDLPLITNDEIDFFKSLLAFNHDWNSLTDMLNRFRQFYEQEKAPRPQQSKSYEGILRDNLAATIGELPRGWGDMFAILCYYNFPHVYVSDLEKLTHTQGQSDQTRRLAAPFLMRFLDRANRETDLIAQEKTTHHEWSRHRKELMEIVRRGVEAVTSGAQTWKH